MSQDTNRRLLQNEVRRLNRRIRGGALELGLNVMDPGDYGGKKFYIEGKGGITPFGVKRRTAADLIDICDAAISAIEIASNREYYPDLWPPTAPPNNSVKVNWKNVGVQAHEPGGLPAAVTHYAMGPGADEREQGDPDGLPSHVYGLANAFGLQGDSRLDFFEGYRQRAGADRAVINEREFEDMERNGTLDDDLLAVASLDQLRENE